MTTSRAGTVEFNQSALMSLTVDKEQLSIMGYVWAHAVPSVTSCQLICPLYLYVEKGGPTV